MTIGIETAQQAIVSAVKGLGIFQQVLQDGQGFDTNNPEFRAPAMGDLIGLVSPANIETVPTASGLNTTTVVFGFTLDVVQWAPVEPSAGVDIRLVRAVDALVAALHTNLDLNDTSKHIDLFSIQRQQLSVDFGWLNLPQGTMRFASIVLPVMAFDAYTQTL